ncbi:MAG: DUF4339 domain-containing protein, partial [Puniceicoccales bacterium]|nr:DUF4339 domain-containing protein [Puniceicoccales bacterium]
MTSPVEKYYYANDGGQTIGPVDLAHLKATADQRRRQGHETFFCKEGDADWRYYSREFPQKTAVAPAQRASVRPAGSASPTSYVAKARYKRPLAAILLYVFASLQLLGCCGGVVLALTMQGGEDTGSLLLSGLGAGLGFFFAAVVTF